MEITAQMVSRLREETGVGMMECKNALKETEGDIERAKDLLRAKGKAGAEKRSGRTAADGVVAIQLGASATAMVELNSETDFVARNEEFIALASSLAQLAANSTAGSVDELLQEDLGGQTAQAALDMALAKLREHLVFRRFARIASSPETVVGSYVHTVTNKIGVLVDMKGDPSSADHVELAKSVAMHIAASKPEYLRREDVPVAAVEREHAIVTEQTRNEGKPEAALPKIVEGRMGKFFERVCLIEQPYVRDGSKRVGELVKAAGCDIRGFNLFIVGQE